MPQQLDSQLSVQPSSLPVQDNIWCLILVLSAAGWMSNFKHSNTSHRQLCVLCKKHKQSHEPRCDLSPLFAFPT